MAEKENHIRDLIVGLIMGMISFLPGVSGGFVAMIGGIYERLIDSLSNIFKTLKQNFFFLACVFGAMGVGMFLASKVIEQFYHDYEMQFLFFFLGLIVLQLPDVYEMATEKDKTIKAPQIVTFIIGFGIMIGLLIMQLNHVDLLSPTMEHTMSNFLIALLMGIVVGMSKVLPGLSWATVFLALGLYSFKVDFVSHFDIFFLIALAIGFVIGAIVFSKIMTILLAKWYSQTYFLLFGIIVGSIPVIYGTIPPISGWEQWAVGIVCLLLGAIVGRIVSVYSRKIRAEYKSANEQ